MPQDPTVTFARTVAWIFVVLFFGYLVYTYLQENKQTTPVAGTTAVTPASGATPKAARTPKGRAGASPTAAPQSPGPTGVGLATATALTVKEAMALVGKATPGAGIRLRGDFVVTASGASRVVLRSVNAAEAGAGVARVLVVYPARAAIPDEGARVSFAGEQALEITDVRRDANGIVNIYTRNTRATSR